MSYWKMTVAKEEAMTVHGQCLVVMPGAGDEWIWCPLLRVHVCCLMCRL